MCVSQLEEGRAEVENQYARVVRREGNRPAQQLVREVFEVVDRTWRGIGRDSRQRPRRCDASTADFDAERRFGLAGVAADAEPAECLSGLVLQGLIEAARVPGLRQPLHAGAPAGRDDGVVRGRLRRLLPLPPLT